MNHNHAFERQHRTAPRQRFNGGGYPTDRHPSDTTWSDIAVWAVMILIALGCVVWGVTYGAGPVAWEVWR